MYLYFAGDASLHKGDQGEREANAVNLDPLNQFCSAEVDAGKAIESSAHAEKKMKAAGGHAAADT